MKKNIFIILVLMLSLIGWLTGCQNEEKNKGNADFDNKPRIASTIYRDGLDFARLGDAMADLDLDKLGFSLVGDSLEEAGGYNWLSRTIHLEDGEVVLEGNFIDNRQFDQEKLGESRLNRVRIGSPFFQTADSVSVGMSLAELQAATEGKDFFVTPLPRDGLVDLEDELGHIHYLIEADMTVFSVILEQANPISVIPPTNKIKYIVVM